MKTFDSFRSLTSLRYLPALTKQFIPNGAKRTMCRAVDNVPNQTGEFRLGIEIPVSIKTLNVADRELLLVLPDPDKVRGTSLQEGIFSDVQCLFIFLPLNQSSLLLTTY